MLWQWYMMTGLPPLLFSPTSRHILEPRFLIWNKRGHKKIKYCHDYKAHAVCLMVAIHKSDSQIQIYLELSLGWRSPGRLCWDTRRSSCTEGSLSASGDQRYLHTCAIQWRGCRLRFINTSTKSYPLIAPLSLNSSQKCVGRRGGGGCDNTDLLGHNCCILVAPIEDCLVVIHPDFS